ncbi:MAG: polyprenol monophosphomannose synthase [Anaerolineae bacterium]|nr:MAG: polyprenol monophosphomannose synthase [Anaerolineae bacterium]
MVLQVTIVVPTYNEAENLPKLVSALFTLPLENLKVLVVDDNSPDGTGQIADDLAVQHPGRVLVIHRAGKLGLRTAYLEGFRYAIANGAEAVGQMDADFSHDPAKLVEMVAALQSADVAFGSRYVPGGSVDREWPLWRKWLSAFGNFYARTILGFPLRDVTTGYRLWRREAILGMPLERIRSNGYVFLVEMAYMAWRLGYRVAQVPIYFADRKFGKSKMSFRIQIEAAFRVWQVKWQYRDL